jgi:hypothetical protein
LKARSDRTPTMSTPRWKLTASRRNFGTKGRVRRRQWTRSRPVQQHPGAGAIERATSGLRRETPHPSRTSRPSRHNSRRREPNTRLFLRATAFVPTRPRSPPDQVLSSPGSFPQPIGPLRDRLGMPPAAVDEQRVAWRTVTISWPASCQTR